ncbi:MAG: DUF2273 domain-containing protein [Clostridia bacterium]|nr:DUF2273 domain-containing protein [Clostridia bacterium]
MDWDTLWRQHRGKILGVAGGLAFGLLVVALGFWWAIFVLGCMIFGYWVGMRVDEGESLRSLWRRITGEK